MFLLWMILYNYIIPLSMYVCLELGTKNYSKILKKFKMFDIQKFQNIQYLKSSNIDQVRLPGDAEVLGKPPVSMGSRVVRCRARPGWF